MTRTTFLNVSKEDRKTFRIEGRKHLLARAQDFHGYMEYGLESDDILNLPASKVERATDFHNENSSFFDYGLSVDYVSPGTFKNTRGYLRYQLSCGGPSEEVRFYLSPGTRNGSYIADRIEFVYLNWNTGVGFDVTKEDWAIWLWDWFNDAGTVQAEIDKAQEND